MVMSGDELAALTAAYENAGSLQQQQIQNSYKLGKDQIAAQLKIAAMTSANSKASIEATRDYQRGLLAQAAAEMQNIGIPQVEIQRFVANTNAEIAKGELAIKQQLANLSEAQLAEQKQEFAQTYGLQQQQFGLSEAGVTGTYQGNPTLAAQGQQQQFGLAQGGLMGVYGGQLTQAGRQQMLDEQFRRRQQALDEAERQRQYGLSVAQYGSQLASQPDQYFQARRFQTQLAPRLLGQDTSGVSMDGSPTPQIQTMGALMRGYDPTQGYVPPPSYAEGGGWGGGYSPTAYGGPSGGTAGRTADTWGAQGTGTTSQVEGGPVDDRHKQIAQISKASPPSPYDGLNEQDAATLRLMESIYKRGGQGIAGGELERLDASGGMGFLKSAGTLLGYDPNQLTSTYQAYRPSQGDARAA